MARKKKHEEHENLERWLISYADFITLLFALFVVLYAMSEVDASKLRKTKNSFAFAFGIGGTEGVQSVPVLDKEKRDRAIPLPVKLPEEISRQYYPEEMKEFEKIKAKVQELFTKDVLKKEAADPLTFEFTDRGLEIRFQTGYLFDSGSAAIRHQVLFLLAKTAKILKELGSVIAVAEHPSSASVDDKDASSNLNIFTARASAIVKHFVAEGGFPPDMISVGAYGEPHPIAPNDTEGGREVNRRIDIVAMSKWEKGNEP